MAFLAPASPAQTIEILDQTFPRWGEGMDRAGYGRYNAAQRLTPWGARHLQRLVLADGQRWLATAKRYDLRGRLDGRDVAFVGIGAVFTPEPLRRRGHAAELLRRIREQAQGEGVDFAILFSEIGERYYRGLGFGALPITQLSLGIDPADGPPAIPIRAGGDTDIPAICEMNGLQAVGSRFCLVRDAAYVAFTLAKKRLLAASGRPGHRRVEFFVVEEGGRPAAYLVLLAVGDYWMIAECGDRDPSGARVGAMLQSLSFGPGRGPMSVRAWMPPGFLPPQVRVLRREVPPLVMMIRPTGRPAPVDPPLAPGDIAWWHADAF